jgi:hypothetical protein
MCQSLNDSEKSVLHDVSNVLMHNFRRLQKKMRHACFLALNAALDCIALNALWLHA